MILVSGWLCGLIECTQKTVGHTSLNNCVVLATMFVWQLVTIFVWQKTCVRSEFGNISWCDIAHTILQNYKNYCKTTSLEMRIIAKQAFESFKKKHKGIHRYGPTKWVIGIVLESCVMSTKKSPIEKYKHTKMARQRPTKHCNIFNLSHR